MPALELIDVFKSFTLHLQGGLRLPVVDGIGFTVAPGECVALVGPSGTGKSSILKMIYGSYRCDAGHIMVRDGGERIDIATADPRRVLALRQNVIGYVSQFLRAVPRVPALDVVCDGASAADTRARAAELLARLNIPEPMWQVPPATFSGGEQQRVNLARGFLRELPVLLLDEPTASLDAKNRAVVVELVDERKRQGAAIVAIVHDEQVRDAIADTVIDIGHLSRLAA